MKAWRLTLAHGMDVKGMLSRRHVYERKPKQQAGECWTRRAAGKLKPDVINMDDVRDQGRLRWSRLSEQIFRVDKWSVCRG